MWAQVSGGEVIRIISHPVALTVDEIQYPSQIFSAWDASELKNIGIYPYSETLVNQKYHNAGSLSYNIGADAVTGTYTSTEKDVAELKKDMVRESKDIAGNFLLRDDWMVIREAEGGTAMPDDLKTYRAAIRKESNDKETAINALSDLDAVKLYEATRYIQTRKTQTYDKDTNTTSYGSPNVESEQDINLVTHYFTEDPLAEADPGYVSLVKK